MKQLLAVMAALLCSALSLRAQSGSWAPEGADLSYPRTLLKASALSNVRDSLAAPSRLAIYHSLWADVQATPPTDNTSTSGRRARATFAKNAAFVVLLGQQPDGGAGLAAMPEAQRTALVASVQGLLESINTDVEVFATQSGTTPYNEWQWRSKELIDYLVAYDLLRGAGMSAATLAASQAKLQEFAGHLYTQSTTPLATPFGTYTFYGTVKNNHTLMTAAALGMAGVVLSEATSTDASQQPANWASLGLYHLDNVLWRDAQRQSDSTQVAGYSEGPYYLKYALLNCLPFFRAMGNFLPDNRAAYPSYTFGGTTRRLRNPYFDPKYRLLYDWLTSILMPDGRLPALEDSYVDMGMPELALTGQPRYVKPMYFSKLSGTGMNSAVSQLRDVTVDMRAAWLAAAVRPTPQNHPALTVLPGSGNLVFRSGNDSLATYLHVYGRGGRAEANAGGHNQGDAGSFILHAQGQLLALDPGYLSYGRRGEVGQATNHNLVLVDDKGPALGTPTAGGAVPAIIRRTLATPQLTYGEVVTAYQGASLTRKTLFIRGTYFLLADSVGAAAAHTYTWQLHGYGLAGGTAATGTFTDSLAVKKGIWQKNGVSLLAHVTVSDSAATYTKAINPHETTYNTVENHTTLRVQTSAPRTQTQFLAVLYPYSTQPPPRVATTSRAATTALATTTTDGFIDVAFAQADTLRRTNASGQLPDSVSADGRLNFYSATAAGDFAQLFVQQGTLVQVGADTILRSTKRADLSWQRASATRYEGSASRATTLTLALDYAPKVEGAGITDADYTYNSSQHQLRLVLRAATSFAVVAGAPAGAEPLPVVLIDFGGQRQGTGVLLSWHTASEQHNRGFEVARRTAETQFETIGFVASASAANGPASYAFRDATAPATMVYYRLRQLDQQGPATYSPVVALAANALAASVPTLLPVAPQPAHDALRVQVAGTTQPVTLRLLDGLSRVVRQQLCQQSAQLAVGALPPGLYYLAAYDATGQPLAGRQKVLVEP